MTQWTATSYGALELRGEPGFLEGTDLVVTPTTPHMPVALNGDPAALWRRLVEGLDDQALTTDEFALLLEFQAHGIAGTTPQPHAVNSLDRPWFVSPLHELVYAIIARVGAEAGIDLVFIKGPMQHKQGLRSREHSGDVDVWVRPADQHRLAEAMYPWGWKPIHGLLSGTANASHSQTLWPVSWGCAIDVHTRFPGMNIEPDEAFETLRTESETWSFAGIDALVPSKAVNALLRALHDVRPIQPDTEESLSHDAARSLKNGGDEVLLIASRFKAVGVLQNALREAFPDAQFDQEDLRIPDEWQRLSSQNSLERLQLSMRGMSLFARLRVLRRLLWPDADTMFGISESRNYPARNRLHARLYWWRDGLREALPAKRKN